MFNFEEVFIRQTINCSRYDNHTEAKHACQNPPNPLPCLPRLLQNTWLEMNDLALMSIDFKRGS